MFRCYVKQCNAFHCFGSEPKTDYWISMNRKQTEYIRFGFELFQPNSIFYIKHKMDIKIAHSQKGREE